MFCVMVHSHNDRRLSDVYQVCSDLRLRWLLGADLGLRSRTRLVSITPSLAYLVREHLHLSLLLFHSIRASLTYGQLQLKRSERDLGGYGYGV